METVTDTTYQSTTQELTATVPGEYDGMMHQGFDLRLVMLSTGLLGVQAEKNNQDNNTDLDQRTMQLDYLSY